MKSAVIKAISLFQRFMIFGHYSWDLKRWDKKWLNIFWNIMSFFRLPQVLHDQYYWHLKELWGFCTAFFQCIRFNWTKDTTPSPYLNHFVAHLLTTDVHNTCQTTFGYFPGEWKNWKSSIKRNVPIFGAQALNRRWSSQNVK